MKTKRISKLILVLLILSLLPACALRIESSNNPYPTQKPYIPSKFEPLKSVPVLFTVVNPTLASQGVELAVNILDDVNGFAYSKQQFAMQRLEDGQYQTTILLPKGGQVFYRYSITAPIVADELDLDGKAIIYRLGQVAENTVFNDIIASWPGTAYSGGRGLLNGIVINSSDDAPLADVMLNVAGQQTFTDTTGRFFFNDLPEGVHTLLAYPIDGSYAVFQQQVHIVSGLSTPAVIKLVALPAVEVTFNVTTPEDAIGAPLRISGNYYQFGASFTDQYDGLGNLASRMPILSQNKDGSYSFKVTLHAGNDLRYKYTLGDSYTNAERDSGGNLLVRRFIVPKKDNLTVNDVISTWRVQNAEPAAIIITAPGNTPHEDSLSIQFQQNQVWGQAVPMWPMGQQQWIYLFYGDGQNSSEVYYRICRNGLCNSKSFAPSTLPYLVNFTDSKANQHSLPPWPYWSEQDSSSASASSPAVSSSGRIVGVELLSDYHPSYFNRYHEILAELKAEGINWLILSPSWRYFELNGMPHLKMEPSRTMLITDLVEVIRLAKSQGFKVALFPRIDFGEPAEKFWARDAQSAIWWQQWYPEYERFVLNFATVASKTNVDQVILGGPDIRDSLPGFVQIKNNPDKSLIDPESLMNTIIKKLRTSYQGSFLWAITSETDVNSYTQSYINSSDGIYFLVNSEGPLDEYITENSMSAFLDGVLRGLLPNGKEAYLGINGPSFKSETPTNLTSDYFIPATDQNYSAENVDLEAQRLFYQSYADAFVKRDWLNGFCSRGFFPIVKLADYSSSIYGKPAMSVLSEIIQNK